MGNCISPGPYEETNKGINRQITQDKKRLDNEVKLLLLGTGESGKSTIAKQMKIIHLQGFTEDERLTYKSIIYNNMITSMKSLLVANRDLGIGLEPELSESANAIKNCENQAELRSVVPHIRALWQSPSIQKTYARQDEFQLYDSAGYYFDNLDRIAAEKYIPDEQDVLRARSKTAGIIETVFEIDAIRFRMVDVGGQRSERKKWMHCFEEVTAILFCVAVSEYNLKLYEDDTTNRMQESLKIFHEIANSKWLVNVPIMLFLNKKDLFVEKIKQVDLTVAFPEYRGGLDYENAINFIKDKFQSTNPSKTIYSHVTTATETDNIDIVFNVVKDIILTGKMSNTSDFL
eukprot:TRINITY_DN728_c0_g1_i1.p1 TRINITY_DN728_c0_g1~~TRINITY_DN728_c0_g1_i1.p1  ORF type:complete len:356 (-),score=73.00 TRINITY_DN728_c0_g1_i1:85-1122(-)